MSIQNMKIGTRLFVFIGGILLFLSICNVALIVYLSSHLFALTERLYRHPFTVTKTVRDAHIKALNIRIGMKDVIQAKNLDAAEAIIAEIHKEEEAIAKDFALIKERYLGDPKDAQSVVDEFAAWTAEREITFDLLRKNQKSEAAQSVNSGRGNERYLAMKKALDILTEFAGNKAVSFLQSAEATERNETLFALAISVSGFLISLFILMVISRTITLPLRSAVSIADRVSEGNLDVEIPPASRDEVGQVLQSMQNMVGYLRQVAAVADKVARQELHAEVHPKSAHDMLNLSLQRMLANLRQMVAEIERSLKAVEEQNWLKDGVSQLSQSLVGDMSLDDVCQKALQELARYVNAGHGALYVHDAEHNVLQLRGMFAFTEEDALRREVRLGEGIVGQVARERAPITLTNVPHQHSRIDTGTTSEPPLTTYTLPAMYNNELYGVIELATSEALSPLHEAFLTSANSVVAMAIFSAQQRERVHALLQKRRLHNEGEKDEL